MILYCLEAITPGLCKIKVWSLVMLVVCIILVGYLTKKWCEYEWNLFDLGESEENQDEPPHHQKKSPEQTKS